MSITRHLGLLVATAVIAFLTIWPLDVVKAADRFQVIELPDQDSQKTYLRVDLQTGALSHCSNIEGVWTCSRLQKETTSSSELLQRLDDLENRLAKLEEEQANLPDAKEFEQMMDMSETMMRRFFGVVQGIKQEMAE